MNPRVENILTQLLEGVLTPNIQANLGDAAYMEALDIYIDITGAPHVLPIVEPKFDDITCNLELPF